MGQLRQAAPRHVQGVDIVITELLSKGFPGCIINEIGVKGMDVMPHQHPIPYEFHELCHHRFYVRSICHHFVRNSIDRRSLCRNMSAGVHQRRIFLLYLVVSDLES
jgi:hypothetical protein